MPRLELAGGGIFENKYERVVAETQAQLLAFIPEVAHVWGFVRGSSKRWYWNGAQWSRAGFVGSGPIDSAPSAALYWGQGKIGPLYYNTTDGQPYVSVRSFHNEGADYGNWGRPAFLSKLRPTFDQFSLQAIVQSRVFGVGVSSHISLGATIRQILLYTSNSGFDGGFVGNVGAQNATATVPLGAFSNRVLAAGLTSATLTRDGILQATIPTLSSATTTENLYIGGSDGNAEGETLKVCFADGSGTILACFNANSPIQWDGGATATDSAGNTITFTDGTPTGRATYSWVKLSDAQAWGVFV